MLADTTRCYAQISNMLLCVSLQCNISTPLDDGEALVNLCNKIQLFMPDNFMPTMAAMAGFIMGICYIDLSKAGVKLEFHFCMVLQAHVSQRL